jgi:hypothetical protein
MPCTENCEAAWVEVSLYLKSVNVLFSLCGS